jgi:hypothetical protein
MHFLTPLQLYLKANEKSRSFSDSKVKALALLCTRYRLLRIL